MGIKWLLAKITSPNKSFVIISLSILIGKNWIKNEDKYSFHRRFKADVSSNDSRFIFAVYYKFHHDGMCIIISVASAAVGIFQWIEFAFSLKTFESTNAQEAFR